MKRKKRSIPFALVFASVVILASNNFITFIDYIRGGDVVVYGFIVIIMAFSLYNLDAIRELLT